LGAGLGVLGFLDDRVDVLLGLLGDEVERAPAGLVIGDLGAIEPRTVDVAEQVILRADLSAQLIEGETGSGGFGHWNRISAGACANASPEEVLTLCSDS